MSLRRFLCLLLPLALTACGEPSSYEEFVKSSEAVDGVYAFTLELSTEKSYDMWICTRDDAVNFGNEEAPLALELRWVAPSGNSWEETVYVHCGDKEGNIEAYREDSVPAETGEWKLYMKPGAVSATFRGLGLICTSDDGTRQTP